MASSQVTESNTAPRPLGDQYELGERLGAGSFAEVYQARQRTTGQLLAVKFLRMADGQQGQSRRVQRFLREVTLCAGLNHPHIVRLVDAGQDPDGRLYSVFEYVPGETLEQRLERLGALGPTETLHLMTQVLDGLSCAHRAGVVHRDLKPANIMVNTSGGRPNAVILDFGVGAFVPSAGDRTRLTATREAIGTPCYAAPEQLKEGYTPTPRSDLYAWGLIFLECLTGKRVMEADSLQELLYKQLAGPPIAIPPALLGHPLGRMLQQVTNKDVEQRAAHADELLGQLVEMGTPDSTMLRTIHGATTQMASAAPALGTGAMSGPANETELDTDTLERRQTTLVAVHFDVDAVEAGQTVENLDVEQVDQLLHGHYRRIQDGILRLGGSVESGVGRHLLLSFGIQGAQEDDVRRAARAALLAVRRDDALVRSAAKGGLRVSVRAGIQTGVVLSSSTGLSKTRESMLGRTGWEAIQLADGGESGEVRVSSGVAGALRRYADELELTRLDEADTSSVYLLRSVQPTGRFSRPGRSADSPLVGRERELSHLRDAWQRTCDGSSEAVLVMGEAGIGKSRLLAELAQEVPDSRWLECRCSAQDQHSPYRPIRDLLRQLADGDLRGLILDSGADPDALLPWLSPLIGDVAPSDAQVDVSPQRRKALTHEAVVSLLAAIAQEHPIVFVVEDVHWADPTTRELLALLVGEARDSDLDGESLPICFVMTARENLEAPWAAADVQLVQPRRLRDTAVQELVRALATGMNDEVLARVVSRAGGNPLFIEELTRLWNDRRSHGVESGRFEVSDSVRSLFRPRLDRLAPELREVVQQAAVLARGRELGSDQLAAVLEQPVDQLEATLQSLSRVGILHRLRRGGPGRFAFKHVLMRDIAYEAMVREERVRAHGRVADVLVEQFPEVGAHHPELLAHHYTQGARPTEAIAAWQAAALGALGGSALEEAAAHLQTALTLVPELPDIERDAAELGLQCMLAQAYLGAKGYSAPEVEAAAERARVLCESAGEITPPILYAVWAVQLVRGDSERTVELAARMKAIAGDPERPATDRIMALASLGCRAFYFGELSDALKYSRAAGELYAAESKSSRSELHKLLQAMYFEDVGIDALLYTAWSRWFLGEPDRALEQAEQALELARDLSSPWSTCMALCFLMVIHQARREPERALQRADEVIALSGEKGFPFWWALAKCGRGWARMGTAMDEARTELQEGLATVGAIGARVPRAMYQSYLAELHLAAGDRDAGLSLVDEELRSLEGTLDQLHLPELLRLKGELLRLDGGHAEEAVGCFRQALDVARRHGSVPFQLRAATSLARASDAPADREGLRELHDSIPPGVDTPELRDAAAVLF